MNLDEIKKYNIKFEYIHSSGPGGQNVNKVSTAVQLRFNVQASQLPQEVKQRLMKLAGRRLNSEGILIIEAKRFRTREKNKEDAFNRFLALIQRASVRSRKRIGTSPTLSSREKRLRSKKIRGAIKRTRRVLEI